MGYKPNITFSSNSEDWEEHKLSEFMSFSNGFNGGKELYVCGVKYISVVDILNNDYIKYDNIQGNVNIDDATFARFCVNYGDVLFQRSSENVDDAGKSNVYIDDTPAAFGGFVIRGKRIAEFDPFFMKHLLDSGKVRKQITAKAQGAQHINVSQEILSDIKIYTPMTEQQLSIGALFRNVNNLIATHKQKQDELIRVKKYMLQKMFPKNGERVPKVRFAGFTDAWEQRKLSELATMHARIGWQNLRTSEFLDDGDYMLITGTDFDDGHINFSTCHYVEKERYDQDKHIQISDGSILITKDGTLGKVAYVKGLQKPATLNAGVFNVEIKDENEVDGKYLFQYLKAPFLMDYVSQKATGGTIKHLNQNILVDFPVVLPEKPEQEKIGQYFEDIDNLITLHQRKYDELMTLKQFFLQNMF